MEMSNLPQHFEDNILKFFLFISESFNLHFCSAVVAAPPLALGGNNGLLLYYVIHWGITGKPQCCGATTLSVPGLFFLFVHSSWSLFFSF